MPQGHPGSSRSREFKHGNGTVRVGSFEQEMDSDLPNADDFVFHVSILSGRSSRRDNRKNQDSVSDAEWCLADVAPAMNRNAGLSSVEGSFRRCVWDQRLHKSSKFFSVNDADASHLK